MATGVAAQSFVLYDVLYADDITMLWGAACTCATRHLPSATVVASAHTAGQYNPLRLKPRLSAILRTVAFYCCAETAGLLDPDDDSDWVFYEYESRPEGPVGWYYRNGQIFDPNCPRWYHLFERSSRAEAGRWRLAWIIQARPRQRI